MAGYGIDKENIRQQLARQSSLDRSSTSASEFFQPGTPAAVLIPLVAYPEEPAIILTERATHLHNHPAEISFPGGSVEPRDPDARAAALREAQEEIGLDPARVEILGCLPPYLTISDFRVTPVVGWIEPPVTLAVDENEVANVFELPLSFVLNPAHYQRESSSSHGRKRDFYVLSYRDYRIWGATAAILVGLAAIL